MDFLLVAFLALAILSTTLGGLFALKLQKHLHPLIGLAAGLLIGVAFLDLLPESLELVSEAHTVALGLLAGFLFYLILERFMLFHACQEPVHAHHYHAHDISLVPLIIHRAMDGFVIALSFQSSAPLGIIVSLAIVAHSFPDGVNAVTLMLSKKKLQFNRYILSLGLAILAGALAAQFLTISDEYLGLIIAFVAGWFLYLGASDLLPEAHHDDANLLPLLTTLIGIGFMLIVTTFLHA